MKTFVLVLVAAFFLSPIAAGAEEGFEPKLNPAPATPTKVPKADRVLSMAAWPGYAMVSRDRTALEKSRKLVFASERVAFAFDLSTSGLGISPHSRVREANPMNTLFGNQNRTGILTSMTSWEMGYSYSAAVVPHWFEHTKYRVPVRIASIMIGGFLVEEHVRSGVCNIQIARQGNTPSARSCDLFGRN
jgi:hypothetical protein